MNLQGTELVNYTEGRLSVGENTLTSTSCDYYWDYYHYPYYPTFYPTYHCCEKSKVEQSFKIVGKLLEKNLIKELKIKEFIKLVNDIAEII